MKNILLLILVLVFSSACSDEDLVPTFDGYENKIKLEDSGAHSLFIESLKDSDIDYRIGNDEEVRYRSKDHDKVLKLVSGAHRELRSNQQVEERGWRISKDEAEQLVLQKYPGILKNARIVGPMVAGPIEAPSAHPINSFVEPNEEVWQINIICNDGGMSASFFVHPARGDIYELQSPNAKESTQCSAAI